MSAGIPELRRELQQGQLSAEELLERCLTDIAGASRLNAVLAVDAEGARQAARAADRRRDIGEPLSELDGIPLLVKDNISVRDFELTCGSRILEGYVAPYDATAVSRLRAAGMVLLGRTNCDEFGMGSSNEHSAYGPVAHPRDAGRVPGGSSGGSAAAVAAGLVPAALGTDTGGSVRQPAAFCGLVGVRPTYGRVSRYGLVAFASSLDQIGPLTPDCRSAALLLETMAGADPRDSTALTEPVPDLKAACEQGVKGLRIGVPRSLFESGVAPGVLDRTEAALQRLADTGAHLEEVQLPHHRYSIAAYYLIANAEASSNLARFDGVRYGRRGSGDGTLTGMYRATRTRGFGPEVKRRILLGTFALSAGYYEAYYRKAQQVRTLVRHDYQQVLADVDAICHPTSPTPAFLQGEKLDDPLQMYLADVFTLAPALAGLPCLSAPAGCTAEGLPVGLHVTARALDEATLFRIAAVLEGSSP